jgi:hypothetical protein
LVADIPNHRNYVAALTRNFGYKMADPILCSELADFPNHRFGSGCIHYFRNMLPGYYYSILGYCPSLDFDMAVGSIHFAVDK